MHTRGMLGISVEMLFEEFIRHLQVFQMDVGCGMWDVDV
jgi:hypothetical protein